MEQQLSRTVSSEEFVQVASSHPIYRLVFLAVYLSSPFALTPWHLVAFEGCICRYIFPYDVCECQVITNSVQKCVSDIVIVEMKGSSQTSG